MKQKHDTQYHDLLLKVLTQGNGKNDRTGTGTRAIFDHTMKFDLSDGSIPLLTTKTMHWPSIIHEILWYISGDSNIQYLLDNGVRIWKEWADDNGDLGPLYGTQLRKWPTKDGGYIDQLANVINTAIEDPFSRRMVVSYWNPEYLPTEPVPSDNPKLGLQALAPCHYTFQLYVEVIDNQKRLSLKLTQRSADVFLGVPFNIAQYAILLHMLAKLTSMEPGNFIWSGGDIHLYNNHIKQAELQLSRDPFISPSLALTSGVNSIDDFTFDDFYLLDYCSYGKISAKVAV